MGKAVDRNKEMDNTTIEGHIRDGLEFGLSQFIDIEGNRPTYEQLLNNEEHQLVLDTVHVVMSGWIAAKGVDQPPLNTENLLRISKGKVLH